MPKVKVPRKSTSVDMTAMCDVAFLLLTFFILTSKFRPDQPVVIDLPTARSQTKIDGPITISVDRDGKAYLSMPTSEIRIEALNNLTEKYGDQYPMLKTLTPGQKAQFSLIEMLGTPIEQLPQVLSLTGSQYKEYQKQMAGIPTDSATNQLGPWLISARLASPSSRVAIKGDKFSNIVGVQRVIEIFKQNNLYKFNLITSLEGAAPAPAAE
jgi:biopolymer transport protein ExbD